MLKFGVDGIKQTQKFGCIAEIGLACCSDLWEFDAADRSSGSAPHCESKADRVSLKMRTVTVALNTIGSSAGRFKDE